MQIEIDFDVYKGLTALRKHENHTYNDVLRELLSLEPALTFDPHPGSLAGTISKIGENLDKTINSAPSKQGLSLRNLYLPTGTRLRATYKGTLYLAEILEGRWIDKNGTEHTSPSAAASYITQTNVNGWRFWEALRPSDTEWRRLDMLA